MVVWLLIGCLSGGPALTAPGDVDESTRAEYAQRKLEAGLDPVAQVVLALWCERHGLMSERNRHLSLAALRDPNNPRIRSLLGQVKDGDGWKRADEPVEGRGADPVRKEYDTLRDKMKDTAAEHEKLADWSSKNGLDDEADAHLRAALRLDPNRSSVWRKLGYWKDHGHGRWVNDETLAAEKAETEEQKKADKEWTTTLESWLKDLRVASKRDGAIAALDAIDDPRALRSIWKQVVVGKRADPELGVRLLAHFDSPWASSLLGLLAVQHDSERVRNQAAQSLRCRDPREFAGNLIEMMGEPIRYEVRPVGGPGSPGVLYVEGQRADLRRNYSPPNAFAGMTWVRTPMWRPTLVTGPNGLPALLTEQEAESIVTAMMRDWAGGGGGNSPSAPNSGLRPGSPASGNAAGATPFAQGVVNGRATRYWEFFEQAEQRTQYLAMENLMAARTAQAQLAADVAELERRNEQVRVVNERIHRVLGPLSGLARDANKDIWRAWYQDSIGARYYAPPPTTPGDKPVIDQTVPIAFQPDTPEVLKINLLRPNGVPVALRAGASASCFARGTRVHARHGLVAIEELQVGDQVLALDTRTGALGYKPIVRVVRNPPSETLRIRSKGETVTATTIHRFWRPGKGWALARDLAEGDSLRGIRGPHVIEAIQPGKTQPVYNLEVADYETFFVGQAGWLVRDHSIPDLRERPYDAAPASSTRAQAVVKN